MCPSNNPKKSFYFKNKPKNIFFKEYRKATVPCNGKIMVLFVYKEKRVNIAGISAESPVLGLSGQISFS